MFLFILMINPLIILNLYLVILGNASEKTQSEKNVLDAQELAEMIYEAEVLLFCNRKHFKPKFIHVLREQHVEIQNQNTSGQRVFKISQEVNKAQDTCLNLNSDIRNLKGYFELKSAVISKISDLIIETTKDKLN